MFVLYLIDGMNLQTESTKNLQTESTTVNILCKYSNNTEDQFLIHFNKICKEKTYKTTACYHFEVNIAYKVLKSKRKANMLPFTIIYVKLAGQTV